MNNKEDIKFVAFILSHGRANNVETYKTLKKCGYTGDIRILVDDTDTQLDKYKKLYGKEVVIFNKEEVGNNIDKMDNFGNYKVILYARNVCFDIARDLGYTHFIELDDDYNAFSYTFNKQMQVEQRSIKNLDVIFNSMVEFLECSDNIKTISMSQRGDFIGGKENNMLNAIKIKRKAMNSFVCSVKKSFKFMGTINEDVNVYTYLQQKGFVFCQTNFVALNQQQTQKNDNGMTDIYKRVGTYVKSFYSVIAHPAGVKVKPMGWKEMRLHHFVNSKMTFPKILKENLKK